jgi:adenosylcobinamide-GDP ribazoletransferase
MFARIGRAFLMCVGMFTAIPTVYRPWEDDLKPLMIACLPAAGLLIGALWLAFAGVLRALGAPAALAAALLTAAPILLTGAIHLDGYMDTADAILSWRSIEERLRILKDPHTGSFSVVSLGLLLMTSYGALLAITGKGGSLLPLLLIPGISRACSAYCVARLKPLAHSEYAGKSNDIAAQAGIGFAILCAVISIFAGWRGIISMLAVAVGYAYSMRRAYRVLGGFSGDLAGAALCTGEMCGLIAMALL